MDAGQMTQALLPVPAWLVSMPLALLSQTARPVVLLPIWGRLSACGAPRPSSGLMQLSATAEESLTRLHTGNLIELA